MEISDPYDTFSVGDGLSNGLFNGRLGWGVVVEECECEEKEGEVVDASL